MIGKTQAISRSAYIADVTPVPYVRDIVFIRSTVMGFTSGGLLAVAWSVGDLLPPFHRTGIALGLLGVLSSFPLLWLVVSLAVTGLCVPVAFAVTRLERGRRHNPERFTVHCTLASLGISAVLATIFGPYNVFLARRGWGPDDGFSGTARVIAATTVAVTVAAYFAGKYFREADLDCDALWIGVLHIITWMWIPVVVLAMLAELTMVGSCAC